MNILVFTLSIVHPVQWSSGAESYCLADVVCTELETVGSANYMQRIDISKENKYLAQFHALMTTELLSSSSENPEIENWWYPEIAEAHPQSHKPLFFQDLF